MFQLSINKPENHTSGMTGKSKVVLKNVRLFKCNKVAYKIIFQLCVTKISLFICD
jgi:hypothetical protein